MVKKTLEEKLVSVKENIESVLQRGELNEDEYRVWMHSLLFAEEVIGREDSPNGFLVNYISARFMLPAKIKYSTGVRQNYISYDSMPFQREEHKKDIESYEILKDLAGQYALNNVVQNGLSKSEFKSKLYGFIYCRPELEELKEERKNFLCKFIIEDIITSNNFSFKNEELYYGDYNLRQLNEALLNLKKY